MNVSDGLVLLAPFTIHGTENRVLESPQTTPSSVGDQRRTLENIIGSLQDLGTAVMDMTS